MTNGARKNVRSTWSGSADSSARVLGQSAYLLFRKVDEFGDEGKRHALIQHAPDRLELRQFDAFFASFFPTFLPTFLPTFFSPLFSSFFFEFPDFLLQIGQHFVPYSPASSA